MNTTCTIETKPKIEHKVKRFVRRMKEGIKPTHARIRYDTMANKWAVLNDDNSAHHHFTHGVMTNVTFVTQKLQGYDVLRCGYINANIGIAEGDLRENYYGNDAEGFTHMGFDPQGGFTDGNGKPITRATVLRVMTDRRALYK